MSHDAVVLRTLRLALCLCIGLIPVYGMVYAAEGVIDIVWIRGVASALAVVMLVATYVSEKVRTHSLLVMLGYLGGVMLWIGSLVHLNDIAAETSLGFLFVLFGAGSLLGVASRRILPLAWFLGGCSAIGVAISVSSESPGSDPWVFALSVCATSLILALVSYARIREQQVREERDRALDETEHLALIGSWSHDLRSSHREWSDGMFRLVGASPRPGEPPEMFDYVLAEDRAGLAEVERELMAGDRPIVDHRYAIRRADGSERHIHSIVRLIPAPDGRPGRLVGVVMDITEQTEREKELERARAAAEDAAALQKSILANMSHEIRTPLTAVIGYAQLLEEEGGADLADLIVPIRSGGERLLDTLNSVLDLARMDAGQLNITTEPLDVTAEVRTVAGLLRQQAASRGLTLTVDAPEAPVWALGDTHALGRSLTNLISNAIKFTTEGSVTVRVSQTGGSVRVDVIDTGRGMSPEFQARLFEPFRQESTGSARSHEGTGLGLAITLRLVEAMGGTVSFESQKGVGTTFSFVLPAEAPQPDLAPDAPKDVPAWIALPSGTRASGAIPELPRTALRGAAAEPAVSEPARSVG